MAIELERLIATLEARLDKYEKAMRKAQGLTDSTFNRIERRGKQMESRMAAIGRGISAAWIKGLAAVGAARGFQQLIDVSTRIENSLRVAGLAGEDLTAVYDRLFDSAQKNAAPLEALVDLYGRASLVQNELKISTEELLGFTDKVAVALRVSGKSAAESSGALLQLSQALGSGIVRAEEFNSILEGALPIAQAAAAGLEEAGGSVAKLRSLVIEGKVSSEAFFRAFEAGSQILTDKVAGAELTVAQETVRLQNILVDAAGKIDEVAGASDLAAAAMNWLGTNVQVLGEAFVENQKPIRDFLNLLGQAIAMSPFVPKLFDPASALQQQLGGVLNGSFDQLGGGGSAELRAALQKLAAGMGGGGSTVSLADFPATGGGGLGGSVKRLRSEYDAWADDGVQKLIDKHEELASTIAGGLTDSVRGIWDAFKSGENVLDAILSKVMNLGEQLLFSGVQNLLMSALTGGGLGGGWNIPTSFTSGGFFPAFPGRAMGGRVNAGQPYTVGESGREMFVPESAGRIVPISASKPGGAGVTNNFYIDAKGAELGVEEKIVRAIRATVPQMIKTQAPAAVAVAQSTRNFGG